MPNPKVLQSILDVLRLHYDLVYSAEEGVTNELVELMKAVIS